MSKQVKATLVLCAALVSLPGHGQEAALPGGASQLVEIHGNWRVQCGTAANAGNPVVQCALLQEQSDSASGQRLLAAELQPAEGGLRGALILPFGLALSPGVTISIDDAEPVGTLSFRTCLPVGCLVDLTFSPELVAALRAGTSLNLAVTADGGQPGKLAVALGGLSSALDRAAVLLGGAGQ